MKIQSKAPAERWPWISRNRGWAGMIPAFNSIGRKKGPEGPESCEDYEWFTTNRRRWQQ